MTGSRVSKKFVLEFSKFMKSLQSKDCDKIFVRNKILDKMKYKTETVQPTKSDLKPDK